MIDLEQFALNYPKNGEHFLPYLRKVQPPLDPQGLSVSFLYGEVRERVIRGKIGFGGDASLLLTYKMSPAGIACVGFEDQAMEVIQIKGAGRKGYRVTQGLDTIQFYADQIRLMEEQARDSLKVVRISAFPQGIEDSPSIELALQRVRLLAERLNLTPNGNYYSREIS